MVFGPRAPVVAVVSLRQDFNGLGEMQSFADANETDVPRTYDLLGRLLTRTGGGINETLRYDGLGNVVYAASTGSTVRRTFDSRALMRGESLAFTSGPSYQTQYEYDSRGANTKIVYPSGRDVRHTYSTAGVLEEVQDYTSTPVTLARYKNLGTDRVLERFYRPGAGTEAVQRYTYDGKGRVSGTKSQVTSATAAFDWRTNAWDRMNNRTDRRVLDPTDSSGNTALRSFTYAYDDLDRMTGSSRTEGTGAPTAITYALDQSGNRTNVTGDVNWGAYSMVGIPPNSVHAYEQTPYDTGPRNYDDNGNYTGKSGETIAYDGRNRMSSYTDAGGTTTYQYDALGRRIAKTASGVTTHFVYAVEHVIEEHSGGVLKASYVYGAQLDEVLQMKRDVDANGTMEDYWYHQDDMLNVVAVTNASGAVVERYEYKDYGLPEIYDDSWNLRTGGTAIGNTLMFNGRPYDAESGLYNFRARYLDPKTGRFTSRDPMGMWHDGLNLGNGYTYCNNNPWSMRDPFGLEAGGNEKNWFERMKDKWNDFWDWVGESSVNDYDAFAHNDMVDVVDMYSDPNYNGEYSRVLAAAMFSEFRERLTQGAIEASMTSLGIVADAVIGKVAGDVLGKVLGIVSRPLGAMLGKAIRKGMGWVDNAVMAGRNFGNWAGSALRSMFGTSSRIVRSEAFAGIKAASQVLQNAGVPRAARVQILQSFEAGTVNVGRAGANQFGLRYFGGNAPEYGRFLFDTFPASRQSLALRPEFNAMTSLRQFQIRPGATMITGRIAPQGLGYEGGQIQYFVIDPVRDLLP